MENKRFSATAKGKSIAQVTYQPPRKDRVKVQDPKNEYLLQKHSLTLIGRVTNPSSQKVQNLLPFFTEKWSTESRPVGSDLGQGMFQFQFEREEDLLKVLEKRPYNYARWMVIVQRWEPTTAPDFPSLIPFWIKVQGVPVHLWTEETIQTVGKNIGVYEDAEISSLNFRMRVHINGRLPLITSSIIEYPNGDEVVAKLVYENLERHCSKCFRLDHELRDCLQAKAEKKERLKEMERQEETHFRTDSPPRRREREDHHVSRPTTGIDRRTNLKNARHYGVGRDSHKDWNTQSPRYQNQVERHRPEEKQTHWYRQQYHDCHQSNSRDSSRARTSHTSVYREVSKQGRPRSNSPTKEYNQAKNISNQRAERGGSRDESSNSKEAPRHSDRGIPLRSTQVDLPREAVEEAIGEIRDVMIQYTSCADPTESAARKERFRQAEEQGQVEETAVQMVKASLATQPTQTEGTEAQSSPARIPALLRLGPTTSPPEDQNQQDAQQQAKATTRRKPGRPPGSRKSQSSPNTLAGANSRKRKVLQTKPPSCRRKLSTTQEQDPPVKGAKNRAGSSKTKGGQQGSSLDSDQPLCKMIPATMKRKKTDFQNPLTPVP